LALRALGLGDFLTAVPALRALRLAHPGWKLVLAAPAALRPLADLARVADRHLDTSGLGSLDWVGPPPHLAVNLHGQGPQSHWMLKSVAPRAMVAFDCGTAEHEGPCWRHGEHEVRRWCRLLEESLTIPSDPEDLRIDVPAPQPGTVADCVVIHPGAAFASRRWLPERFASVARWATAAGYAVVVTGSAGERALAHRVARAADLPADVVRAGATDVLGLADQIARACLVVCGDTGVAHVATAFGTPSVLLFGPTAPAHWGPLGDGPHTVLWHGDGAGDPWGTDVDPALAAITTREVVEAAEHLLGRQPVPQALRS
jgi:ADP-heptose:LPS heptosyltransferase